MVPWLSIVIPTKGRPELTNTLDSIDAQVHNSAVQVVVVGDTHGGRTPELERAKREVFRRGNRYRWLEQDGGQHMVGHPQRQYGMEQAVGEWLAFSADDNIFTDGAIASIWMAVATAPIRKPLLFKVRTWQAGVVWQRKELIHGNIDADCAVVPNVPEKLGRWENVYEGDFYFIKQTVQLWDNDATWADELIGLARPAETELWWRG